MPKAKPRQKDIKRRLAEVGCLLLDGEQKSVINLCLDAMDAISGMETGEELAGTRQALAKGRERIEALEASKKNYKATIDRLGMEKAKVEEANEKLNAQMLSLQRIAIGLQREVEEVRLSAVNELREVNGTLSKQLSAAREWIVKNHSEHDQGHSAPVYKGCICGVDSVLANGVLGAGQIG